MGMGGDLSTSAGLEAKAWRLPGQASVGGLESSMTSMTKVRVARSPHSVATLQVTMFLPMGRTEPEGGSQRIRAGVAQAERRSGAG